MNVLFRGETVKKLYSLDYANRSYHPYTDLKDTQPLLSSLEQIDTNQSVENSDKVGFLVFTDQSKYAFYLDAAAEIAPEKSLVQEALENNKATEGIAQWLAYMSTSNITKVYFDGSWGPEYSLKAWPKTDHLWYSINVEATDIETIQTVSDFLKSMKVEEASDIYVFSGTPNPANNLFSLSLTFSIGVSYAIFGDTTGKMNCFTIYSSDMEETITYKCTENTMKALLDCMADLKTAVITPSY